MADNQKKKPNKLKRILPILIVVAIGFAVDLVFFQGQFRYAGTLEATKVDISSQVPSAISAVNVHEGDHVESGQNLISLACADIRVADELATINYKRNLRLFKAGTASQETLDQMKNRKDDADVRLGWCEIQSPHPRHGAQPLSRAGRMGERRHEAPDARQYPRHLGLHLRRRSPMSGELKPGMKLTGHLPEMHDREFTGTILKINDEAEFTPKNVQTRAERDAARLRRQGELSRLERRGDPQAGHDDRNRAPEAMSMARARCRSQSRTCASASGSSAPARA